MTPAMQVVGSIDVTRIHRNKLILEGWVIIDRQPPVMPLILHVNGKRAEMSLRWSNRPDIQAMFGEAAGACGFHIETLLLTSPFDYPRQISLQPDFAGAPALPVHANAEINRFTDALTTQSGFFRYIQNPGTRIRHEGTLTFLATRAVALHRRKPALQASALCVLAWRDLLDTGEAVSVRRILRLGRYLMARLDADQSPLGQRWFVSLANALAFMAWKNGDPAVSNAMFREIVRKTAGIDHVWLCVPNGTTARFMLGYLALARGDLAAAQTEMEAAMRYFESRVKYWQLVNTWSFDELHEVGRLAQQAFQIFELLRTKGKTELLNAGGDFEAGRITTQLLALGFKQGNIPILSVRKIIAAAHVTAPDHANG